MRIALLSCCSLCMPRTQLQRQFPTYFCDTLLHLYHSFKVLILPDQHRANLSGTRSDEISSERDLGDSRYIGRRGLECVPWSASRP